MLQVHNKQSELYVRIYIQEFSIHVYKCVYLSAVYNQKQRLLSKSTTALLGRFPGCSVDPSAEPDSALLRRNGTMQETAFVHFRSTAA